LTYSISQKAVTSDSVWEKFEGASKIFGKPWLLKNHSRVAEKVICFATNEISEKLNFFNHPKSQPLSPPLFFKFALMYRILNFTVRSTSFYAFHILATALAATVFLVLQTPSKNL
jgi:hypothetical protein